MTGDYLEILLEREGPPPNWVCCVCDGDGAQKYHDCLAEPMFCTRCCRTQHTWLPFHQISQWNGDFFERTTLMKDTDDEGPSAASSTAGTPGAHGAGDNDGKGPPGSAHPEVLEDHNNMGEGDMFLDDESPVYTTNPPVAGKTCIMVVHTLGVHTIIVRFCQCAGAQRPDKQLFKMGLFPASFAHPKMAFTFSFLDDFILNNLECGTSAMNYYSKLRHITSSMFLHLVPDRYRELMRVARQWRQLKLLKWNGFSHNRRDPKDGELGLFCPACPQPGINVTLLMEVDDTKPGWLYSRSLVMDGNFKAEHLHPMHQEDEVWLTNGKCFMVARARYQAHLALAKDSAQRSECNNHRAVNQATGIGGCTCARHGCFMPNSVVDFQKGERQMNMDYMLCNALAHNTDGLRRALTFYDVNCQYNKHLRQRVDESLHLRIPSRMDIIPGIGLWHIHGHQDKCYVWYASNFIPGAARIDGEVMETLWAPLNIISPSARGMSTPHRQECLDYQMNDCNFMKMIWMGLFLSWKYKEAKRRVTKSTKAFDSLNDTADLEMVEWWEVQERHAQASRVRDLSALDIYDVQLQKDIVAMALINTPGSMNPEGGRGRAAAGVFPSHGGKTPTRSRCLDRIWDHHRGNADSFGYGDLEDGKTPHQGQDPRDRPSPDQAAALHRRDGPDSGGSGNEDSGNDQVQAGDRPRALFRPEIVVIPLPSNLGMERCEQLGAVDLVRQEITLREGQANDMLHAIRVHLADKAILFRTTVRPAKSQARSTRAWAQVHSVERVINLNSMIYRKCRAQLHNLRADQLLEKCRVLEKSDLKATSVVADLNTRGQRNSTLPWFWSLDVQGDSVSNNWMNKFYRVHWLWTKALWDRWEEEFLLVEHEMHWTINFLVHRSRTWLKRTHQNGDPPRVGHTCYAIRQAQMYRQLAEDAHARFVEVFRVVGNLLDLSRLIQNVVTTPDVISGNSLWKIP
ncbi:hypothetical protein EDB19DRAFT_1833904 [Suillus lakei]|nr:hypothetical protein EDB19DRAFT_1833904 [Suillus lakei]